MKYSKDWIFLPSPLQTFLTFLKLKKKKKKEKKCFEVHHIFVFSLIKVLNTSFVAYWIKYVKKNAKRLFHSLPYVVSERFQKFPILDSTNFSSDFKDKKLRKIFL